MHRHLLPLSAFLTLLAVGSVAGAAEEDWDGGYGEQAERRSDFTAGLSVGLGLGRVVGYPNQAGRIDDPRYKSDTGFALGMDTTVWIGGALRDWFTFGVGAMFGDLQGQDLVASSWGFLVRVETYPLYSQGGIWRDIALAGNFGLAATKIFEVEGDMEVANGGALSLLGAGVAWEALRLGLFAFGPSLEYRHEFSESLTLHQAVLSLRGALYTGP